MDSQPGRIVLMGSGEASPSGRRVFDWLFQRLPSPSQIALLETPAGFQPNSALVAQRIIDFLQQRLSQFDLRITAVPARTRGTTLGTDDPELADQVLSADAIFMGPGSPTYAVRQLRDSIIWDAVRLRWSEGGTVVLASAAVLALGAYTLPVYEIYKVGAELGWEPGLDLLRTTDAPLVFVPHWSNREGGAELDTTRCFMGEERFARLHGMLPAEAIIVGIDEHTSLIVDPAEDSALVLGQGTVTLLRNGGDTIYRGGEQFSLSALGTIDWERLTAGVPSVLHERAAGLKHLRQAAEPDVPVIPPIVLELVERRETARKERNWAAADALRAEIAALGVQVDDTPSGPRIQVIAGV